MNKSEDLNMTSHGLIQTTVMAKSLLNIHIISNIHGDEQRLGLW